MGLGILKFCAIVTWAVAIVWGAEIVARRRTLRTFVWLAAAGAVGWGWWTALAGLREPAGDRAVWTTLALLALTVVVVMGVCAGSRGSHGAAPPSPDA